MSVSWKIAPLAPPGQMAIPRKPEKAEVWGWAGEGGI
jgi:hypothetical protein